MKEKVRFLGLDVHAETIAVAVAEHDGEVRSLGTIANREESIRKLMKKLGPVEQLRACYEAGPNKDKNENFPKKETTKTIPRMNNAKPFEDRAGRSRSRHEGESSSYLCDRLSRTRDVSQRRLPTNQDYAVSTREYQTDQSSLKSAPTAAGPVLEQQQKNDPTDSQLWTGSLHIR